MPEFSQALNQWKPSPPVEEIEPLIRQLWKARLTDKQILAELRKRIDNTHYGIGLTKFLAVRKGLGLERTRQQRHTPDSIRQAMIELRAMYPNAGVQEMVNLLFHEWDLCVARSVVRQYFAKYEPGLVQQRKDRRLQSQRFWAAGVNDVWVIDQHEKWLRFGLSLHAGVEPFSGRILWMRIWYSNRNPQLILSHYLETVRKLGYIPLVTQSGPGTEHFGIANAQTLLRQKLDPALSGVRQHRWMRQKNVMPDIIWSQLHRDFTPGFELLLDKGVKSGWYNVDDTLQRMVFRWLFIPWLQQELDAYVDRLNNTQRPGRNKSPPRGIPILIHMSAQDYSALDFKVAVNQQFIETVSQLYIKPGQVIFEIVPPAMNLLIGECYDHLTRPPMTRHTAWDVYCQLVVMVREHIATPPILAIDDLKEDNSEANELKLLPGLRDLPYESS